MCSICEYLCLIRHLLIGTLCSVKYLLFPVSYCLLFCFCLQVTRSSYSYDFVPLCIVNKHTIQYNYTLCLHISITHPDMNKILEISKISILTASCKINLATETFHIRYLPNSLLRSRPTS